MYREGVNASFTAFGAEGCGAAATSGTRRRLSGARDLVTRCSPSLAPAGCRRSAPIPLSRAHGIPVSQDPVIEGCRDGRRRPPSAGLHRASRASPRLGLGASRARERQERGGQGIDRPGPGQGYREPGIPGHGDPCSIGSEDAGIRGGGALGSRGSGFPRSRRRDARPARGRGGQASSATGTAAARPGLAAGPVRARVVARRSRPGHSPGGTRAGPIVPLSRDHGIPVCRGLARSALAVRRRMRAW